MYTAPQKIIFLNRNQLSNQKPNNPFTCNEQKFAEVAVTVCTIHISDMLQYSNLRHTRKEIFLQAPFLNRH